MRNLILVLFLFWITSAFAGLSEADSAKLNVSLLNNGGYEAGLANWSTYANTTPGATPEDCSGGTSSLTLTTETTSPLSGIRTGKIAKGALNEQGEGISTTFTIKEGYKSGRVQITLRSDVSDANYSDGDIQLFLYDVTNTALVTPVVKDIEANEAIQSFYADLTTGTEYRLCLHVASTNATAYNVYFDEIKVMANDIGAIVTSDSTKILKSNLEILEYAKIMTGDNDDPTSVAKDAPKGSLYLEADTGYIYRKTDAGSSTNWTRVVDLGQDPILGTGTDNFVPLWNGTTGLDTSIISQAELELLDGLTALPTLSGSANQIAVFDGAASATGSASFTFDGSTLSLSSDSSLDGALTVNSSAADKDITFKKETSGDAYKYDAGDDKHTIDGDLVKNNKHDIGGYILNPSAKANTTGWSTYADAAANKPVDCTGGTATTAWTRNTSSTLNDGADFKLAKDAANRQGEGASYAFTIPAGLQASMMQVTALSNLSNSNIADEDIRVYLYDVTNSKLIEPVPTELVAGAKHQALNFLTSPDSTSYRLCFHVASTNATAYDAYFDDISIKQYKPNNGQAITQEYFEIDSTDNFWDTAATTTYEFDHSLASPAFSTSTLITVADVSSKTRITANQKIKIDLSVSGTSDRYWVAIYNSADTQIAIDGSGASTAANHNVKVSVELEKDDYIYVGNYDPQSNRRGALTLTATRISDVQYSDSLSNTPVYAKYTANSGTINTASVSIVNFDDKVEDSHNAVTTGASWKFTAPHSDMYYFNSAIELQSTSAWELDELANIELYKEGSSDSRLALVEIQSNDITGYTMFLNGFGSVYLNKGESANIRMYQNSDSNLGISTTTGRTHITIFNSAGKNFIAASEEVRAHYCTSAGDTLTDDAVEVIRWETKVEDTHNSVSFSTFAAQDWRFTAKKAMNCDVKWFNLLNSSTSWDQNDYIQYRFLKNGAELVYPLYKKILTTDASSVAISMHAQSSYMLTLNKDDYFSVAMRQKHGLDVGLNNNAAFNCIMIKCR